MISATCKVVGGAGVAPVLGYNPFSFVLGPFLFSAQGDAVNGSLFWKDIYRHFHWLFHVIQISARHLKSERLVWYLHLDADYIGNNDRPDCLLDLTDSNSVFLFNKVADQPLIIGYAASDAIEFLINIYITPNQHFPRITIIAVL